MLSTGYSNNEANPLSFVSMKTQLMELYPPLGTHIHEIEFITSSENHTYRINSENGYFAMRVQRPSYHSQDEINAELELVDFFAKNKIATALPVKRKDGNFVSKIQTPEGERLITVFQWVNGRHPDENEFHIVYEQMGFVMGRMHSVSKTLNHKLIERRPYWTLDEIIGSKAVWGTWYNPDYITSTQHDLVMDFVADFKIQVTQWDFTGKQGLIHADMRPTNVILDDDKLIVIDFDDCCYSWYLLDIAATVSFLEHKPRMNDWMNHFISQYLTNSQLNKLDIKLLPHFIGLRRVQLMAWYFSHKRSDYAQSLGDNWLYQSFDVLSNILDKRIKFDY